MKKSLLSIIIIAFGLSFANAEQVVSTKGFKEKIAQAAGAKGVFAPNENFPKDYFLISKNLPFLVGYSLHHPQSSTLNLSQEQIDKILAVKKVTVPKVLKMAKRIKTLELKLADNMQSKDVDVEAQYPLVDEIAQLKTQLTKAHLKCIKSVRNILTDKQFETLKNYVAKQGK